MTYTMTTMADSNEIEAQARDRIWLCGDVHGNLTALQRALQWEPSPPEAILFLGDMDPPEPIGPWLRQTVGEFIPFRWIHGNHEVDTEQRSRDTFDALGIELNIDGKVVEIQGLRIAGLGGIFRKEIWMPPALPLFQRIEDYEAHLRGLGSKEPFVDAKLRTHRSSIFPNAYDALAEQSADVLLIHDAPSCHPHGNAAYDDLAQVLGVKWVAHGHHHDARDYSADTSRFGFQTIGVGKRGITTLAGRCVVAGESDARRSGRS